MKMVLRLLILSLPWVVGDDSFINTDVVGYELSSYDGFPQKGCEESKNPGYLSMDCSLPSGKVTLAVNKAATALALSYEKDRGPFACDELQQTKSAILNYTNTRDDTKVRIKNFTIKNAVLSNESLACPLALLGTDQTEKLTLIGLEGQLRPSHLKGIGGIKELTIKNIDVSITSVPYASMARLPALRDARLQGGAFVLKQEDVMLPELKVLELSIGKLKAIPKRAFANTPALEMLLLFSNEIEYLDVDAFEGLPQLRELSLNSNLLSALPAGVLQAAPRLLHVDLYDNPLLQLHEGVFQGLHHLAKVVLFNNRVSLTLHNRTFANLPSLTELKLDGNSLEALPGDLLSNSTSLKTLSLKYNKLSSLPQLLLAGLRLKDLNLSFNNLSFLWERQFSDQDQLESLNLKKNHLTELPGALFQDTINLKLLDVTSNNISTLHKGTFNKLTQLQKLYLDRNRISDLQYVFDGLVNLEELSLSHNDIDISEHRNTHLESSYLAAPPAALPAALPDAERASSLGGVARLRRLRLAHNRVRLLCADWRRLFHLEELDLSYNNISSVSSTDSNFQSSVTVDLSHNNIHTFDPPMYYNMPPLPDLPLPTFLLSNNPFRCSCSLYPFLLKHKSRQNLNLNIVDLEEAECAAPAQLKGVKLIDVQLDSVTCDLPCPSGCDSCLGRPSKLRVELTCSKIPRNWTKSPDPFVSYSLRLTHVSTPNRLILDLPPTVKSVDLSNLNLTAPPVATSVTVDLRNNSLSTIPVGLIESNCSLYLENNPIECVCENRMDLMTFVKYNKSILDFQTVKCSGETRLVKDVDLVYLCYNRDLAVSLILAMVTLGVLVATCIVIYKHWTFVRIVLNKFGIWSYRPKDPTYANDIFLSYANEEEIYVRSRVIPELEKTPGSLKLCVASRDWRLGDTITEQIQRSIDNSAVVLALLSPSYVDSPWCQMEFRLAHTQQKIWVVMMNDFDEKHKGLTPEMKAYVNSKTFGKESDPRLFEKIREATEKVKSKERRSREERLKPTGIDTQVDVNGMIFNNALTAPPAS